MLIREPTLRLTSRFGGGEVLLCGVSYVYAASTQKSVIPDYCYALLIPPPAKDSDRAKSTNEEAKVI